MRCAACWRWRVGEVAAHRLFTRYEDATDVYLAGGDAFLTDGLDAGLVVKGSVHIAWREIQAGNGLVNLG